MIDTLAMIPASLPVMNQLHHTTKGGSTMCYSKKQIDNRVKKLADLEAAKKDLEAQIDAIKKDLQNDMGDAEHISGDHYKVNYTSVTSSRFNSKGFSAKFPEVAKAWTVTSTTRRFSWSAI